MWYLLVWFGVVTSSVQAPYHLRYCVHLAVEDRGKSHVCAPTSFRITFFCGSSQELRYAQYLPLYRLTRAILDGFFGKKPLGKLWPF